MNYRQLAASMMNQLALHPELGDLKVNVCKTGFAVWNPGKAFFG